MIFSEIERRKKQSSKREEIVDEDRYEEYPNHGDYLNEFI